MIVEFKNEINTIKNLNLNSFFNYDITVRQEYIKSVLTHEYLYNNFRPSSPTFVEYYIQLFTLNYESPQESHIVYNKQDFKNKRNIPLSACLGYSYTETRKIFRLMNIIRFLSNSSNLIPNISLNTLWTELFEYVPPVEEPEVYEPTSLYSLLNLSFVEFRNAIKNQFPQHDDLFVFDNEQVTPPNFPIEDMSVLRQITLSELASHYQFSEIKSFLKCIVFLKYLTFFISFDTNDNIEEYIDNFFVSTQVDFYNQIYQILGLTIPTILGFSEEQQDEVTQIFGVVITYKYLSRTLNLPAGTSLDSYLAFFNTLNLETEEPPPYSESEIQNFLNLTLDDLYSQYQGIQILHIIQAVAFYITTGGGEISEPPPNPEPKEIDYSVSESPTNSIFNNILLDSNVRIDGESFNDVFGVGASTKFLVCFLNNAAYKKMLEEGPKTLVEYENFGATIKAPIYKNFGLAIDDVETNPDLGEVALNPQQSFVYNFATSNTATKTFPKDPLISELDSWLSGLTVHHTNMFASSQTAQFASFDNAQFNREKEYFKTKIKTPSATFKAMDRRKYYWYYTVPSKPDLGETANVFEAITESVASTIDNLLGKIFELLIIGLLFLDHFLCWTFNYVQSFVDEIIMDMLATFYPFCVWLFFQIKIPIWYIFGTYWITFTILNWKFYPFMGMLRPVIATFVHRKPFVPIARFITSNPMGGNIVLLSKEFTTRFHQSWNRISGMQKVYKSPYTVLNKVKIDKNQGIDFVSCAAPMAFTNSDSLYRTSGYWDYKIPVAQFYQSSKITNPSNSVRTISGKQNIDRRYLGFSVESGKETSVCNFGMPFTIISFEEKDG